MVRLSGPEGPSRTSQEQEAVKAYVRAFEGAPADTQTKLANFPKYVRRQNVTRFLALYEIFKLVLPVKGSVIECGVSQGFGLMSWAHFSSILEPVNLTRRVYGFDTFSGFTAVGYKDRNTARTAQPGDLAADSYQELQELASIMDGNRYLGHIPKVELIKGNVAETIPEFLKTHPHVLASLLFLDLDLYEPTKVAMEAFLPRMPKGAVIAFDELDNPMWPGETLALLESVGAGSLRLRRLEWDPFIAFAVIE